MSGTELAPQPERTSCDASRSHHDRMKQPTPTVMTAKVTTTCSDTIEEDDEEEEVAAAAAHRCPRRSTALESSIGA